MFNRERSIGSLRIGGIRRSNIFVQKQERTSEIK